MIAFILAAQLSAWSFSSELSNNAELVCTAQRDVSEYSVAIRSDNAGYQIVISNEAWELPLGASYRTSLSVDNQPFVPVIADVLNDSSFRVLAAEIPGGRDTISSADQLRIRRTDGGDSDFIVNLSGSSDAVDQIDGCVSSGGLSGSHLAPSARVQVLSNFLTEFFDSDFEVAAQNDNTALLESGSHVVIVYDEADAGPVSLGKLSDFIDITNRLYPDCEINADDIGLDYRYQDLVSASGTFECQQRLTEVYASHFQDGRTRFIGITQTRTLTSQRNSLAAAKAISLLRP